MKRRFDLLSGFFLAGALLALSVMAQHPSEAQHAQPSHAAESLPPSPPRANQGRIPPPPTKQEMHGAMEAEKHENGKVNNFQHVNNDRWYGHDPADDKRYHMEPRTPMAISNFLVQPTATTSRALIVTITAFGCPGVSTSKSLPGIGSSVATGAGTVGMISWFTTIRIIRAGICSTTSTQAFMCTSTIWELEMNL
jgi:hypothetical protein